MPNWSNHEADTPIWARGIGFHLDMREDLFGAKLALWIVDSDNGKTHGGKAIMGLDREDCVNSTRWLIVQYGRLRGIAERQPDLVDPSLLATIKAQIISLYQDNDVVIDPDWLDTLPLDQFSFESRPPRLDLATGKYVPAETWDELQRQEHQGIDDDISAILGKIDKQVKGKKNAASNHR